MAICNGEATSESSFDYIGNTMPIGRTMTFVPAHPS